MSYEPDEPYEEGDEEFERRGSALRKATKDNPRIYPCPTCKKPNRLTKKDVLLHYQCDECADRAEGKYGEYYFKKKDMTTKKIKQNVSKRKQRRHEDGNCYDTEKERQDAFENQEHYTF